MAVAGPVLQVISVWKSGGNEGETTIKQHSSLPQLICRWLSQIKQEIPQQTEGKIASTKTELAWLLNYSTEQGTKTIRAAVSRLHSPQKAASLG